MNGNQREILIFYNPDSPDHRRTVAHARSISNHVKSFPFHKASATDMTWERMLQFLQLHPRELMNKASESYQLHVRGRDFDDEGWLKVLRYNPEILRAPIAIRGTRAVLCISPTDVHKLIEGSTIVEE